MKRRAGCKGATPLTEVGEERTAELPETAPDGLLRATDIGPILRKLPRGSGADVCGWRAEH